VSQRGPAEGPAGRIRCTVVRIVVAPALGRSLTVAIALLIVGVVAGEAPQRPTAKNGLTAVKHLTCRFTAAASVSWSGPAPDVHLSSPDQPLIIDISKIDIDEGTASISTAAGTSTATVTVNGSNLYVLSLPPSGDASVTTVFSQESKNNRLKAVHTRAAASVAQYGGECEVKQK